MQSGDELTDSKAANKPVPAELLLHSRGKMRVDFEMVTAFFLFLRFLVDAQVLLAREHS
jgi:hypothetical protein